MGEGEGVSCGTAGGWVGAGGRWGSCGSKAGGERNGRGWGHAREWSDEWAWVRVCAGHGIQTQLEVDARSVCDRSGAGICLKV